MTEEEYKDSVRAVKKDVDLRKRIDDYIDSIDVDIEELSSYRLHRGKRYDESRFADPDEEEWDEDEEYEEKLQQAYANIISDGVFETLGIEDTVENTNKVRRYLLYKMSGVVIN